ncbi:hypothetical protein RO3G_12111 [Rhizopus delemar RA 99-880]|uniref:Methyltransferase domain-containing protein n=1 Tax=Rhizopus delemar (strain RA 99-880 / ATCC MYA-4621 / FGSC 9543 / NRRL 43880) TaxID=246409 RepID=I1CG20_RHIO9|nr:hypothetical protein RO3G_12111 [Rhizopus delemar RA 99-880]|eukprot:EIE87400.1 hypothetical protein RO3G_12111 [Rhizopus delemar RA 99-880]
MPFFKFTTKKTEKKKQEQAREFHQIETSSYWLPKDEDEQLRQTGQHFVIKEVFGGNVLSSITEALDFDRGISILDIGCGSGTWIMDMISEYPNCQYDGCDIVDVINKSIMLKQFTFKFGNILETLPYKDNTFDFVPEEGGNEFHEMMVAVHNVFQARNQNYRAGKELERWVIENGKAKVIQTEFRRCDTTTGTNVAKKVAWCMLELFNSTMTVAGPALGLYTKKEQDEYLEKVKNCMKTTCGFSRNYAVAAQKL